LKALVTGGGGFLGGAIIEAALARGWQVASISRGTYPALEARRVATFTADLGRAGSGRAAAALAAAVAGCAVVFHTAAKAGVWGKREDFWSANVDATRHVTEACLKADVPRLVHTSSPSVCFTGEDELDASNDLPLAEDFLALYPESKALAERLVLAANGDALSVCALRPHLIFGPGDPHLLPRLVNRGRKGRLKRIGNGQNEVTLCYIENAAFAHLAAAETLTPRAPHAGRAYFIGQEEPVKMWDWIDEVFRGLHIPEVKGQIGAKTARRIGTVMETLWKLLPLSGEPPMTRFVAAQLSTSHSYSMEPAHRDFGYAEKVDTEEATARTIEAFRAGG
jgi:nucleoside-diphosphate-sugar epimerase